MLLLHHPHLIHLFQRFIIILFVEKHQEPLQCPEPILKIFTKWNDFSIALNGINQA